MDDYELRRDYRRYINEAEQHYMKKHWTESRAASLLAALYFAELVEYRRQHGA